MGMHLLLLLLSVINTVFSSYVIRNTHIPCYPEFLRSFDAPLGIPLSSLKHHGLAFGRKVELTRWWNLLLNLENKKNTTSPFTVVFFGGRKLSLYTPSSCESHSFSGSSLSGAHMQFVAPLREDLFIDCGLPCNAWNLRECPKCAIPANFQTYLEATYPHIDIVMHNFAIAGCDSRCLFSNPNWQKYQSLPHVDVVFSHFKVNDFTDEEVLYPMFSARYERFVRGVLSHPSFPIIISISMMKDTALYPPHTHVEKHYNIPIIHVESAVLRNYSALDGRPITWNTSIYGENWRTLWETREFHPAWPHHRYAAELLGSVWQHQIKLAVAHAHSFSSDDDLNTTLSHFPPPLYVALGDPGVLDANCLYPRTALYANSASTRGDVVDFGSWKFGEDVVFNNKPGWWLDSPEGGKILFSISVRYIRPLIGIAYLQSYEKMGIVRMYELGYESDYIEINALRLEPRVSVTVTRNLCLDGAEKTSNSSFPLCAGRIPEDRHCEEDEMFRNVTLVVDLLKNDYILEGQATAHNKFKILSILTC